MFRAHNNNRNKKEDRRVLAGSLALLFVVSLLVQTSHFILVEHSADGHAHITSDHEASEHLALTDAHEAERCEFGIATQPKGLELAAAELVSEDVLHTLRTPNAYSVLFSSQLLFRLAPKQSPPVLS